MKSLLASLLLLGSATALAGEPAADLARVRETLRAEETRRATAADEAARAEQELDTLRQKSVSLAETLQELESALAAMTAETERLAAAISTQETELTATAKAQEDVLASLVQLSRKPPPAVLLRSGGTEAAARAAAVMDSLLNDAAVKSAALRQQVLQLQVLRQQSVNLQAEREAKLAALTTERDALTEALRQKQELLANATADATAATARVKALAEQARSLEDLMTGLQAPVPPPPSRRKSDESLASKPDIAAAVVGASPRGSRAQAGPPRRGALSRPVVGRVQATFGQAGQFNSRNRGIIWRAAPQAVVVAPWGGEVAYAGPFRGYGNIVILKHKGSYYSIISGLARIAVAEGQGLGSGEPLGQMGTAGSALDLYLEFRRNDTPVDPLPWLTRARAG
jgi:septal ring factor EnvC (AmiA/AmiB activator)